MKRRFQCLAGSVVLSVLACAAHAAVPEPAAEEWRHEKVVRIVPIGTLESHVDKHCLDTTPGDPNETRNAIVLRFRVGRAHYYQAFPVSAEMAWQAGDEAAFVPRTCDIKRAAEKP